MTEEKKTEKASPAEISGRVASSAIILDGLHDMEPPSGCEDNQFQVSIDDRFCNGTKSSRRSSSHHRKFTISIDNLDELIVPTVIVERPLVGASAHVVRYKFTLIERTRIVALRNSAAAIGVMQVVMAATNDSFFSFIPRDVRLEVIRMCLALECNR